MFLDAFRLKLKKIDHDPHYRSLWQYWHIDPALLFFLIVLISVGLVILYSAASENLRAVQIQSVRMLIAFFCMIVVAQISPPTLLRFAPIIYLMSLGLLISVLLLGSIAKGGQRWLNFGFIHFQPAELMKLSVPLLLAWCYHRVSLPISFKSVLLAIPIILVPAILTAKQPDLGTAILLLFSGASLLFLAGLSISFMLCSLAGALISTPFIWHFLHDYQKQRMFIFFNPEGDPLGRGYHIIQSKIAIGSGGIFGKGLLNGTQSSLHFLPEHTTDFIFAVCGEELGFLGSLFLITIYMCIVMRGVSITINAQDTFSRLLAGSITFTFFISFFINMGMVTGIVPVVGIPLPLVSYGGSSMMTFILSFGILMSIQTHRKLVTS